MARFPGNGKDALEDIACRSIVQVCGHAGQQLVTNDPEYTRQQNDKEERRAPSQRGEGRCKQQAQWHAGHGGDGKCRHHCAECFATTFKWNHIGNHGLHQATEDATKRAGQSTCDQQEGKVGCKSAAQGCNDEARIQHQQQFASVKAVYIGRCQQAGCCCGECVRRQQKAELVCIDVQQPDQLRTKRHHDHEIKNVRELYAGDSQQEQAFIFDDGCMCR